MSALERVHLRVRGRVQGVGYREFTRRCASECALAGWVRNLPDGSVEALLEGSALELERALATLRKGPRWGEVESLQVLSRETVTGEAEALPSPLEIQR